MGNSAIWVNENTGETAHGGCGGGYLKFAIADRPRARKHVTPLGTWLRPTAAEEQWWLREFGAPMTCETCGRGAGA